MKTLKRKNDKTCYREQNQYQTILIDCLAFDCVHLTILLKILVLDHLSALLLLFSDWYSAWLEIVETRFVRIPTCD